MPSTVTAIFLKQIILKISTWFPQGITFHKGKANIKEVGFGKSHIGPRILMKGENGVSMLYDHETRTIHSQQVVSKGQFKFYTMFWPDYFWLDWSFFFLKRGS